MTVTATPVAATTDTSTKVLLTTAILLVYNTRFTALYFAT
jgi:hypothetical protein